jgi:mannitol-1-/sugar-/sorbitol-6-phosphatase
MGQGLRTADHIRLVAPHLDADREADRFELMEVEDATETRAFPGALDLVAALPLDRWAVVTSSIPPLAKARLRAAGLPVPQVLVAAHDVAAGKPDPEGYLRASELLAVPSQATIVIEDSPAGVEAGRRAGARVIAVPTTHEIEQLGHADLVVPLTRLAVRNPIRDEIEIVVRATHSDGESELARG